MIRIVAPWILARGVAGMALWPFLIARAKPLLSNARFVNHERIHGRQQLELLILPFYLWYVLEFLIRWLHTRNVNTAYRRIVFEREAYAMDTQTDYLMRRPFWAFLKFYRS